MLKHSTFDASKIASAFGFNEVTHLNTFSDKRAHLSLPVHDRLKIINSCLIFIIQTWPLAQKNYVISIALYQQLRYTAIDILLRSKDE